VFKKQKETILYGGALMKLVFLGTRGEIERWNKYHTKQTGMILVYRRQKYLFDCGRGIDINRVKPDYVIVTHGHPDHSRGLQEFTGIIHTHRKCDFKHKGTFKYLKLRTRNKVGNLWITPIPVSHSIRYPTCGYIIETKRMKIAFFPDVLSIRPEDRKHLSDADFYVGDGAFIVDKPGRVRRDKETGKVWGHATIIDQIKWCKKQGVKRAIITHLGTWAITAGEEKVREKMRELSKQYDIKVRAAYDGLSIDLTELQFTIADIPPAIQPRVIAEEEIPEAGMILVKPHGTMIINGEKKAIVTKRKWTKYVGKPVYLIEEKKALGIIVLNEPRKITLKEFRELRGYHRITEKEREAWGWREGPFYYYTFKVIDRFPEPKRVKMPRGPQKWVKKIVFLHCLPDLTNSELEILHTKSHLSRARQLHERIIDEFLERGLGHINIDLLDEETYLIKNWRTAKEDWKKLMKTERGRKICADDHRILHMWALKLKRSNKPFTSPQFKDLSLEEQKRVIRELHDYLVEHIFKELGWKHTTPIELMEKWPSLEEIDSEYVQTLSDADLRELHEYLHSLFEEIGDVTEDLHNAHVFVGIELAKRAIEDHSEARDDLDIETQLEILEYPMPTIAKMRELSLKEVWDAFPPILVIDDKPYHIFISGRLVNTGRLPPGHDIDIIIKQRYPDTRIVKELKEHLPKDIGDIIHPVFAAEGPAIGYTCPLYRLALVKVPRQEIITPWEVLAERIKLFKPIVGLKAKSGWQKYEFWKTDNAYKQWASKYIDQEIILQAKKDGRRMQVHLDVSKDKISIFTEDRKRDRAFVFPRSIEELKKNIKAKQAILDTEVVEYQDTKPIPDMDLKYKEVPRRETGWITVGEERDDSEALVVFHVHDILYLDGETVAHKPYRERHKLLEKIIPEGLCHWKAMPAYEVKTLREFVNTIKKLRREKGSEGVMLKVSTSPYIIRYTKENRTPLWCKIKNLKEIDVMVWEVIPKREKETGRPLPIWVYECYFEIPAK